MKMHRLFVVLGLGFGCTVASQGGAVISFVNAVNLGGGTWQYDYEVTLADNDELNPASILGATCTTGSGTVPCSPSTTFVTLYDIPNLVVNGGSPSIGSNVGWGDVIQAVGVTPVTSGGAAVNPPDGDSGSLENVTFFYTGGTTYCGGVVDPSYGCVGTYESTFAGFSVQVTGSSGATTAGGYTSSVASAVLLATGETGINAVDYGSGSVTIPAVAASPEPGSVALVSVGLIATGLAGIAYTFVRSPARKG